MAGSGQLPSRGSSRAPAPVITTARESASAEMSSRVRRYTITMAFRTACFVAMIFVPGVFKWVLFGCALVLPYVAVLFANQANRRSDSKWARSTVVEPPGTYPEIGTGHEHDLDDAATDDRGAPGHADSHNGTNDRGRDDRVA
jgi:flagellar biosynthesis component FlhA